jgi:hypothetical protein
VGDVKDLNPAKVPCAGIGRPAAHALLIKPLANLAQRFEPNRFFKAMSPICRKLDLVTVDGIAGWVDYAGGVASDRGRRTQQ